MKLIDKNGNLKSIIAVSIGCIGIFILFLPIKLHLHPYLIIGGFIFGIIMCGFSALALQSATLNLQVFKQPVIRINENKKRYKSNTNEQSVTSINDSEMQDKQTPKN